MVIFRFCRMGELWKQCGSWLVRMGVSRLLVIVIETFPSFFYYGRPTPKLSLTCTCYS